MSKCNANENNTALVEVKDGEPRTPFTYLVFTPQGSAGNTTGL